MSEQIIKQYLTADLHLGHKNILTLANRRFDNIEEHDSHIIDCINKTVTTRDHLYILGDVGFHKDYEGLKKALSQINTRNIHIILGNHDNKHDMIRLISSRIICEVAEKKVIRVGEDRVVLFHYPLREWEGFYRGSYHAYGHVHNTIPPYKRSMDVGIDSIGYSPIEVRDFIDKLKVVSNETLSSEDRMIREFFPTLSTHYFVGLCTGNKEIREKILEVIKKEK